MDNKPRGREKNVSGEGKDVYKRGEGLGTGPVGSQDGHAGRTEAQQNRPAAPFGQQSTGQSSSNGGLTRAAKTGSPILIIVGARQGIRTCGFGYQTD